MARVRLTVQSEPSTPSAGFASIYIDTEDSLLSVKTEDGTVRKMGTISAGSTASEDAAATFTAEGDLQDTPFQISKTSGDASTPGRGTFGNGVVVSDDPYDATGWDNNLEVPTKSALRDKIETLASNAPLVLPIGAAPSGSPPAGSIWLYGINVGGKDAIFAKYPSGVVNQVNIDL